MGANNPPSAQPVGSTLSDYSAYLPGLTAEMSHMQPQIASDIVNSMGRLTQGANEVALQQLDRFGLPLAQQGQRINASNAAANAALQNRYNPAYRGANTLINSMNLSGLSPGEAASVERGVNQTNTGSGNLGLVNPMNTISNAINFGGAFNNKLGVYTNAVNAASGAMGNFSPSNPTGSNPGSNQFANTSSANTNLPASSVFGFGNNLMGNLTSTNNSLINSMTSRANTESIPSYLSGVCCFIFLEAYGYGKIPKCVRRGRDKYYYKNHFMAAGYRRMAKWLVPLMRENLMIRWLVWLMIVNPITIHLSKPRRGINRLITHFWLRYWAITGKDKCEADYCDLVDYLGYIYG